MFSALPCTQPGACCERLATKTRYCLLRIDAIWGGLVMWVGMREMGRLVALRLPELAAGSGVAGALWLLGFRLQSRAGRRRRERRMEEELTAYSQLDMRLPGVGDGLELAGRVS